MCDMYRGSYAHTMTPVWRSEGNLWVSFPISPLSIITQVIRLAQQYLLGYLPDPYYDSFMHVNHCPLSDWCPVVLSYFFFPHFACLSGMCMHTCILNSDSPYIINYVPFGSAKIVWRVRRMWEYAVTVSGNLQSWWWIPCVPFPLTFLPSWCCSFGSAAGALVIISDGWERSLRQSSELGGDWAIRL